MAKRVTNKKTAAGKGGLAKSVKARASTVITEVEQAGENVLSEVRDGLGAVTDKIAATAKTVSETQAARTLKNLLGDVEEIGSDVIEAVAQKLNQLRGKVETETAAPGTVRKRAATKQKAAKKVTGKPTAKKKAAAKKKPVTKKKPAAKKKAASKKKAAAKKRAAASKKVTKKKPTAKKTATPRKRVAARR